MSDSSRGLALAFLAFGIWGSFALFFSLLKHVPAPEVLTHRVLWSFMFVLALVAIKRQWHTLRAALHNRQLVLLLLVSSCLIAGNWLLYIWSVSVNRAVDASLGYFISPLVAVCLGVVFLKEKLLPYQKLAVLLATAGVLYKLISVGELPWIALTLASTFGFYGLVRKKTTVDTVTGLMLETALLVPFALLYTLWLGLEDNLHFTLDTTGALLVAAGIITALPLLAFSAAAKHLSLTLLGLMTYVAPTLQLLSAVLILNEPFNQSDIVTFAFIWLGLLVFSGGAIWRSRKTPA